MAVYVFNLSKQSKRRAAARLLLCNAGELFGTKETCFFDQLVEQTLAADEFGRSVELSNRAVIQYDDAVTVQDCVDAVRDRNDRPILEHIAAQCRLQHRIRFDIDSGL